MASQNTILSRSLPFVVYILFLALGDYLAPFCNALGIDSKWLYVARVTSVAAILFYFWRDYVELIHKPKLSNLLVAVIAGLFVFAIWILPYPAWASLGGAAANDNPVQNLTALQANFWLLTRIMGAALVVPIMEELFWRSFIMRWLDSKNFLTITPEKISTYALLISSILFALEHSLWLAGLVAGLVYGWLYKAHQNLWVPIVAHAVTNGVLGAWVIYTGHWSYW